MTKEGSGGGGKLSGQVSAEVFDLEDGCRTVAPHSPPKIWYSRNGIQCYDRQLHIMDLIIGLPVVLEGEIRQTGSDGSSQNPPSLVEVWLIYAYIDLIRTLTSVSVPILLEPVPLDSFTTSAAFIPNVTTPQRWTRFVVPELSKT